MIIFFIIILIFITPLNSFGSVDIKTIGTPGDAWYDEYTITISAPDTKETATLSKYPPGPTKIIEFPNFPKADPRLSPPHYSIRFRLNINDWACNLASPVNDFLNFIYNLEKIDTAIRQKNIELKKSLELAKESISKAEKIPQSTGEKQKLLSEAFTTIQSALNNDKINLFLEFIGSRSLSIKAISEIDLYIDNLNEISKENFLAYYDFSSKPYKVIPSVLLETQQVCWGERGWVWDYFPEEYTNGQTKSSYYVLNEVKSATVINCSQSQATTNANILSEYIKPKRYENKVILNDCLNNVDLETLKGIQKTSIENILKTYIDYKDLRLNIENILKQINQIK